MRNEDLKTWTKNRRPAAACSPEPQSYDRCGLTLLLDFWAFLGFVCSVKLTLIDSNVTLKFRCFNDFPHLFHFFPKQ
jgi:hypothetical protein